MSDILDVFVQLPEEYRIRDDTLVILDDALQILKTIKANSIDLIFSDPPYNIGKQFGKEKEAMSKDEYLNWCKEWITDCLRILKQSGTFYFMSATQFMPYLDSYVDSRYHVISRIVWYYDSSGVQAKKYFGSRYEPILMVVKDKRKYVFNSNEVMVEAKTGAIRRLINYRKTPPQMYNHEKVMGNVWEIPRVRFKMEEYEGHPTQKPERLLERIILASSNKGQIVLDPFSGSFTTCSVAQRLGRKCIGIEKEEEYFKIGLRRLKIAEEYRGEKLTKFKVRKTKNKSKKDHLILNSIL